MTQQKNKSNIIMSVHFCPNTRERGRILYHSFLNAIVSPRICWKKSTTERKDNSLHFQINSNQKTQSIKIWRGFLEITTGRHSKA